MDEQPVQLIGETRVPIPATKENPKRVHHEYERKGTANIFMFAEPLSGFHKATARPHRTNDDWAHEVAHLLGLPLCRRRTDHLGLRQFEHPHRGGVLGRRRKRVSTLADAPVFGASNIYYEIGERNGAIAHGGIGAFHLLTKRIGLVEANDRRLHLLKIHLPYHESDHVLNLAYNALCDGTCLQDIELRRNDEVFLDALDADHIPDPTTAGDFCRRFRVTDVSNLIDIFNDVRKRVWARQPKEFFTRAHIDMDGVLVETAGECKQGMDIAYDGTWGYHPLIVSLANTQEVLSVVNRPGNRPSHDGAAAEVDRAIEVCLSGGFQAVRLRGDTDFSQTKHLDCWTSDSRVSFVFGLDCTANRHFLADELPAMNWQPLVRPPKYEVKTVPRRKPERV